MLMLNLLVTLVSSAGLLCGPQDFQNRELFPCHPLPQHLRAGALRDVFNLPSCSVICFFNCIAFSNLQFMLTQSPPMMRYPPLS